MPLLFAATLFLSAGLLFWVQPLVAKMLLPLLGGTPAVWNTCMLFFQAALLAGYAYALVLTRSLGPPAQGLFHVALLVVAFATLPVGLSAGVSADVPSRGEPVWWLLGALLVSVGLPFFALSATAPLLQKWFSRTRHETAADPYYLYAASNAGSLLALVAFPLLVEPSLRLSEQSRLWTVLYALLVALVAACAFAARRTAAGAGDAATETAREPGNFAESESKSWPVGESERVSQHEAAGAGAVTNLRRLRWAFLAFVPSSLVLGVTTYITTDVAAAPLLWVLPLALYMLTFVVAFARSFGAAKRWAARLLPGAAIVLTLVYLSGATEPAWFLALTHLLFLFIAALACHSRLADERPATRHLAEFYLWIAAGGALGGLFNALAAPVLFDTVVEYPLAVVLACLAPLSFGTPKRADESGVVENTAAHGEAGDDDASAARRARALDVALPVAFGLLVVVLSTLAMRLSINSVERLALALGLPLILVKFFFARRPLRLALGLAAVMLGSYFFAENGSRLIVSERNFYGTLRVSRDPSNGTLRLHHGSTIHGRQFADGPRRCEPLSYYHREGPLGSVFQTLGAEPPSAATNVAAVGLGTGAVAAYSRPGDAWTFYEINPAVVRLSREDGVFTYLRDCSAAPAEVLLGDARLRLRDAPSGHYRLIILDAFSSDAVPAHLLTREALALYLSKLSAGGWLAFHVSNRALNLHAVVGGLARDADLRALVFDDMTQDREAGREPSQWVVLARDAKDLAALSADARWKDLSPRRTVLWRDDFSDIVSVFKVAGGE
jgi:hypothetical protein